MTPAFLPEHAECELELARVADSALHRSVEVEDEIRDLGAAEVFAIEEVEDVEGGLEGHARGSELSGEAEVEGRVLIVLAAEVALGDDGVDGAAAVGAMRRAAVGGGIGVGTGSGNRF